MLHPNFRTELKIREFAYSKRILPNPNFVARFGRIRRFGRLYVKQHSAKRKQLTNSRLSRTNTESRISGICTSLAELKRKWNKEKHACKTRKQITNQESRIIYYHTRYIYIPVCCASSASQPRLTLARDRSCMSLHASYRLSFSLSLYGERERESAGELLSTAFLRVRILRYIFVPLARGIIRVGARRESRSGRDLSLHFRKLQI